MGKKFITKHGSGCGWGGCGLAILLHTAPFVLPVNKSVLLFHDLAQRDIGANLIFQGKHKDVFKVQREHLRAIKET